MSDKSGIPDTNQVSDQVRDWKTGNQQAGVLNQQMMEQARDYQAADARRRATERRNRIAEMMLAAMVANPNDEYVLAKDADLAVSAIKLADALIAELDK